MMRRPHGTLRGHLAIAAAILEDKKEGSVYELDKRLASSLSPSYEPNPIEVIAFTMAGKEVPESRDGFSELARMADSFGLIAERDLVTHNILLRLK